MGTVKIEKKGNVAILTLTNGVTNAVSSDLVNDLSGALSEIRDDANGMVLTGGDKFFSIGLNLPELIRLDRAGMGDFWRRFVQVAFDIYMMPMVTAAAVTGHAPAAGTVFMLACDYRFAAEGKKMLGLNEIKLGIPVPFITDLMLRQITGDRVATDILFQGEFLVPEKALEIKMIDGMHPLEEVLDKAVEKISSMAGYQNAAVAAMKAIRTEDIRLKYLENAEKQHQIFLDCWFSDTTQKILAEAVEKF
ncbi:MAG: enoyl-CoA hydratase/isomerase family protein [Deltaproteobacteria bacterium]|jgi:enoyl-CoA hydratase/carnithine racemase|nr:enoyl-CoA hydratase/isomerase family protein [Deltaproteobacteria bacterium]